MLTHHWQRLGLPPSGSRCCETTTLRALEAARIAADAAFAGPKPTWAS